MQTQVGSRWQADYWNGDAGQRWAAHQAQVDRALEPFGTAMLDAAELRSGERVLDVGCGCGATSIGAAARVGQNGRVVGIDISTPMIERAKERAGSDPRLTFVCQDAATYVAKERFDVLISRYGLMFFEQPDEALAKLREQLSVTGRMAFTAWQELAANEWLSLPLRVVREAIDAPEPPAAAGPSPFAFADPGYVSDLLSRAGFRDVTIRAHHASVRLSEGGLDEAVRFVQLHAGPVGRLLSEVDAAAKQRAVRDLEHALVPFVQGKVVELKGAAWLVTARRS